MAISQQLYPSAPLSTGTGYGSASTLRSGGGALISSGLLPSQNGVNGTYHNPIQVPQTMPRTNIPTSTESTSPQPSPTETMSHAAIASVTTPSAVVLVATVAPDLDPTHPQNVVPQAQIGLDYAAPNNNGINLLQFTEDP